MHLNLNHFFKSISLIFIVTATLLACTKQPEVPLRMGTNVWPGYEPLYLARELGYFPGKDIKLIEYPSASEVIRAFRNNTIEAAALTLDEVLLLAQDNLAPRIIAIADISDGADVILAKPAIKNFSELKGRRIGVERSALGAYILSRALSLHNLTTNDIIVVDINVDEHENAYKLNKVEAVVTFEPVRSKLLQIGAKPLFDSKEIPGEIVDVLVVKRSHLEQFPNQVTSLLSGWFQALDYMGHYPNQAAAKMAIRQGITTEAFLASLAGLHIPDYAENIKLLTGQEAPLKKTVYHLQTIMIQNKLLKKPIQVPSLLAPPLLQTIR